jgi:hypothetical protein
MAGSVNTGTQDREGRTIFRGRKGGFFTRRGESGAKVYRKTMGSQPTVTGMMNALQRPIMKGPRGGLFVMVNGHKRKPAVGRKRRSRL